MNKEEVGFEIENYRELLDHTVSKYPDGVAYKFKKDSVAKEPEYIEKTYSQFKEDIEGFSTSLLNLGLQGKKVILIGANSYTWCASYLSVTTGDMIIVPLDRVLPASEIETLVVRSEAEAAIFDASFEETFIKIKKNGKSNLKHLISMNDINNSEILNYSDLEKDGKEKIAKGDDIYAKIEIDSTKMSMLLFTSGTTSEPKGVMLSQFNICQNVQAIAKNVKMYPTDTLLSFLPIHHTFECTVTFLYGIYYGVTVAFCDGLKYIAKNLAEYKVSVFVAVPLVLETMYKKIRERNRRTRKNKDCGNNVKNIKRIIKTSYRCKKEII